MGGQSSGSIAEVTGRSTINYHGAYSWKNGGTLSNCNQLQKPIPGVQPYLLKNLNTGGIRPAPRS